MSDKIREYIEQQFLVEFDDDFPENSDLFKEGVMDSFGYVQMCRFLEKEFNIRFSEQEMTTNILTSLSRIRACVAQKQAQAGLTSGAST